MARASIGASEDPQSFRHARLFLLSVMMLSGVASVHAQPRAHGGGAVTFITETHSTTNELGGTTWGGSLLLGVSVSPRLSVEFEPSFVRSFQGEYTYSPSRSLRARVITRRRDTFLTFQLRGRAGFLEPVVGVSYVRGTGTRHATFLGSGRPYFDGRQSQHGLAVAGGVDAVVKLTPRLFFVPTFRAFVIARPRPSPRNPGAQQTGGGRFAFRYGAGARVTF